ncbi:MAG TPA: DUF2752 domain-containing protein [Lachnospiraceae bacterium]|nr:DUF2752 domain-containing protein [Lachnospiraceae bacterium]
MKKLKDAARRIKRDIWNAKWALLALICYLILMNVLFGTGCSIKAITGVPCPGCGMTRAFFYLLSGKFALSFQMHPLLLLWLLYGLYLAVMRYWYGKRPKGMLPILFVLCALMFAVYVYRMAVWFPNQDPMVYGRPHGVLYKLIEK